MQTNIANKFIKKSIFNKKYIIIIGLSIGLILVLMLAFESYTSMQKQNYIKAQNKIISERIETQKLEKEKENKIDNMFIVGDYSSKSDIKNIIKQSYNLPNNVVNVLSANDIKINYTGLDIANMADYKGLYTTGIGGLFDAKRFKILLAYNHYDCNGLLLKYNLQIDTFHEIGHTFDYNYNTKQYNCVFSCSQDFNSIFKSEAVNFFNLKNFNYLNETFIPYLNYFANNKGEYFAECFGLYFTNSETNHLLKACAPKTYNYINVITSAQMSKYSLFVNNTMATGY